MSTARGIRNNNFGNLRKTKDRWKGLRLEQTDPSFFQFTEPKWGYRALIKTLQSYRRRRGCRTISDFIRRWAPDNENNTEGYIASVCRLTGWGADYVPDVSSMDEMCRLAAAISRVENGTDANMDDIKAGWGLI